MAVKHPSKALRWWYIIRYHRTSQLVMRLVGLLRRKVTGMTGGRRYERPPESVPKLRDNPNLASLARCKASDCPAKSSASNARDILEGRYRFLNAECQLPEPIDWRLEDRPDVSHLWRFHLHYHEFLLDLAAEGLGDGDRTWFDRAWELVAGWIDSNRLSDRRVLGDAWHPYCISRRLPVWIYLWSLCPPAEKLRDRVLVSMFCQARYLSRHLEWDVRGNHLLENAKALVLVGAFLRCPDADRWLAKGRTTLQNELAEQILPHGEHFERSPMYHAGMLEAVLDVRDAVATLMPELARSCGETAAKMAAFLQAILHPDGDIPLLGDACLGETVAPGQLIGRATESNKLSEPTEHPLPSPAAASGGTDLCGSRVAGDYWIYRHADDFLIFDAGPVGPDYLPAHAHADLLSLEASIRGRRLFVDSGTFGYRDDRMRRYCRGSRAHNVLVIDGRDQCDVWSRFRMGHRGRPAGLAVGEESGFHWARAHHNAYRRLGAGHVGRWLACRPAGPWICVDWANGTGRHDLANSLHLHPDVTAEKLADDLVRLELDGLSLSLHFLTAGRVTIAEGWYCPEFGRRDPAAVIHWTATQSLPAVCGWWLARGDHDATASVDQTGDGNILLRWTDGDESLQLPVRLT